MKQTLIDDIYHITFFKSPTSNWRYSYICIVPRYIYRDDYTCIPNYSRVFYNTKISSAFSINTSCMWVRKYFSKPSTLLISIPFFSSLNKWHGLHIEAIFYRGWFLLLEECHIVFNFQLHPKNVSKRFLNFYRFNWSTIKGDDNSRLRKY